MTDSLKKDSSFEFTRWLDEQGVVLDEAMTEKIRFKLEDLFVYWEAKGYRKGYRAAEDSESRWPRSAPYQN